MKYPTCDKNNGRPKPKSDQREEKKEEDLTFWEKILRDTDLPKARKVDSARRRHVLQTDTDSSPLDIGCRTRQNSPQKTTIRVAPATSVHSSSTTHNDAHDELTEKKKPSNTSRRRLAREDAATSRTRDNSCPRKRKRIEHVEPQENPSDDDDSDCERLDCGTHCCGSPSMIIGHKTRSCSQQDTEKVSSSSTSQNNAQVKEKKKESKTSRKRLASRSATPSKTYSCPRKRKKTGRAESGKKRDDDGADCECSDCGHLCCGKAKKKRKKRKRQSRRKRKPCCC